MHKIALFIVSGGLSLPVYDDATFDDIIERYDFANLEITQTCTENICVCHLPDEWQGERNPDEYININTVYYETELNEQDMTCTDYFNQCAYGVGFDLFVNAQQIKTDLIETGVLSKEHILGCLMRKFYFSQRAPDVSKLYDTYLSWYAINVLGMHTDF